MRSGTSHSEETRARIAATCKARLADPQRRALISAAARATFNDPAQRAVRAERLRQMWQDPAKAGRLGRRKHLADLSADQLALYRLYRRKQYPMAEALALVRGAPAS